MKFILFLTLFCFTFERGHAQNVPISFAQQGPPPKFIDAGDGTFIPANNQQSHIPPVCQRNRRHPQCVQFFESGTVPNQGGQVGNFPGQGASFPGQPGTFPGQGQAGNFPGQGQAGTFPGQGGQGGNSGPIPNRCRGNRINRPQCAQYRPNGGGSNNQNNGGIPRRCRGNKIRRPECAQFRPAGQGNNRPPNCRGNRRQTLRCRDKNRCERNPNHPSCSKPGTQDPALSEAFSQLSWLQGLQVEGNSILIPGLPETPANAQNGQTTRNYQLAFGAQNIAFQRCLTPRRQLGDCRFVQHCILPEFANNFNVFLQYFCIIQGRYVGACCPRSQFPDHQTRPPLPTTPSTTTPRPPTRPTDRGCGVNSIQQTKIVGGRPAQLNKYPWIAALLRNTATTQYCGGVLISDRHVMTAAHCVDGFDANSITIRLGEYSFNDQGETRHKDFKVARIKMHERYSTTTYVNDIAILTLDRSTAFSDSIWPVCLPPSNEDFVGQTATVVGWGTIYFGGPVSNVLQEVSIPVWRNSDCDAAYTQDVFAQNLCAGDKAGGKDSCQGDSGGPLLLEWGSNPKRWIVIGVVSWGIRCAEPDTPGVYARVNMFLDWINSNMV